MTLLGACGPIRNGWNKCPTLLVDLHTPEWRAGQSDFDRRPEREYGGGIASLGKMTMPGTELTPLHSFHQYLTKKLGEQGEAILSPEEALAEWREEQGLIAAIKEGLADVEAGRTFSLDEFEQRIREKLGMTTLS